MELPRNLSLTDYVQSLDRTKHRVVLATGVFDLLHRAHKGFLLAAKRSGDVLLVGLESDTRVKQIKGESRPINPQIVRKQNLEAWGVADYVFVLPEQFSHPEDHEKLIALIRPDILAVSAHSNHLDKKQAILSKYGGQVKVVYEFDPTISTTQLLAEQKQLQAKKYNRLIK